MTLPCGADGAFAVDGQLHAVLKVAIAEIASMPQGEKRTWALRGVASLLLGEHQLALKAAAVEQCPELASIEPIPDTYLGAEEQDIASRLTLADMQALDSALIAGAVTSWRSVARVVGDALVTLQGQKPPFPLGVLVCRVGNLVRNGTFEAQGDTHFMRLGEVRLATGITRSE